MSHTIRLNKKSILQLLTDYLALTKPRVMSLLLFSAATGAFLGSGGVPNLYKLIAVLLGGALASGGASALNMWFEADLDRKMGRTKGRPVAQGRVRPRNALIYGLFLNLIAFTILSYYTTILAGILAMIGTLLYIGLYTILLKRSTVQNIVIGGAAGAIPPLVGYAAITNTLALNSWFLFLIVFLWTPPHFWALALMIRKDYSRVGIPMLPVVAGKRHTTLQILLYSLLVSIVSVLFSVVETKLNYLYFFGSVFLGVILVYYAFRLHLNAPKGFAWSLYRYSLLYLAGIFTLIMVDVSL